MFKPKGPYCQSCGMPISKDPKGGGTNKDGTKNIEYCSFCFQNGDFTNPTMDVKQMQELCIGKLKEMHFPSFVAKYLTKDIPSLNRWRK